MKKTRSSPTSLHRVACPHLGRAEARHAPLGRPTDAHRCFLVVSSGEPIPHRQQAQHCLSPEWGGCYKLQPDFIPPHAIPTLPTPAHPPAESPPLSLAAQRLLSHTARQRPVRPPSASEAGLLGAEEAPLPPALRARTAPLPRPLPLPDLDAPLPPPRGGGWQTPVLWTMVAVPGLLLAVAIALMGIVWLGGFATTPTAQAEAGSTETTPDASLLELVAATPVATFLPVSEAPNEVPAVPTLPPTVEAREEGPIRPGPWPLEAASGAPDRIRAPRVGIDAPVIPVGSYIQQSRGQFIRYYEVAQFAAGWHDNSSLPGFRGNVVLAGHHNTAGKVFEHAIDLEPGDFVFLDIDGRTYPYLVVIKELLPETTVSEAQRNENGKWIGQTNDERLTLVTCWPPNGNTHRVVIVAIPAR